MAFWGIEVKPGNRYTHLYDQTRGRLRVTQATLGNTVGAGKSVKPSPRTVVQCNYGDMSPVLICSLLTGTYETCHLELEFEEQQEVVFSVLGQRSIHLSGYFIGSKLKGCDGSEDTNGEDIAETESEGSEFVDCSDEDSYESDFIDDDDIIDAPSFPLRESRGEAKPSKGEKRHAAKRKKWQVIDSDDGASDNAAHGRRRRLVVDSEEEDEFPISGKDEQKTKDDKRKSNEQEKGVAKCKKIDNKAKNATLVEESKKVDKAEDKTAKDVRNGKSNNEVNDETKKKKKNKMGKKGTDLKQEKDKAEKKQPQKVQTFANGLIIEDISMGQPDGQIANPGCKVYVNYVGRLQNGTAFDSNVGQKPFKFRLGKGQVIEGWDVGINGMRVGDKRRLTIPPTLGYGDKKVGKVPKNSWLDFDVELVKVK